MRKAILLAVAGAATMACGGERISEPDRSICEQTYAFFRNLGCADVIGKVVNRVGSALAGAVVSIRADPPDAPVFGSLATTGANGRYTVRAHWMPSTFDLIPGRRFSGLPDTMTMWVTVRLPPVRVGVPGMTDSVHVLAEFRPVGAKARSIEAQLLTLNVFPPD